MREGLRIIEEASRFYLNDNSLTYSLKTLRHKTEKIQKVLPFDIIYNRESKDDIGRSISFDRKNKGNILSIVKRAFGRVQESSRVLEEYGYIYNKKVPEYAKYIRFESYELEKTIVKKIMKKIKVFPNNIGLYLIMTEPNIGYEKLTRIAVKNNVKVIQLRDKNKTDKELLKIARRIKRITEGSETLFIVNDRIDIAILSNADGVHLGQEDISVENCRKISEFLIIGKSTHNLMQLKRAIKQMPDYVGIGPLYKTYSKKIPDPVLGLKKGKNMLLKTKLPAIGIGGINDKNLKDVLNAGFVNFGIISYINYSDNPDKSIKNIIKLYRSYYDTKKKCIK